MFKKTQMIIRISDTDKKLLKEVAKRNNMSLSAYVLIASVGKARKDKK